MYRIASLIAIAMFAVVGVACAFPPLPRVDAEPKKNAPKVDPKTLDGDEVDVQKTAERIAENAQKAGDRLKEKDPGADTRKIQDEIIKDIDALIKKAQQPPPPPMSSDMPPPMMPPPPKSDMPPPKSDMPMPKSGMTGGMPMPMGGTPMGGMPMPKSGTGMGTGGGTEKKEGRRPRRERKDRGEEPMGMQEPMPMGGGKEPMPAKIDPKEGPMGGAKDKPDGGDKFGKASPRRENDKLAELYKDVWGHLPDRMRQEMDLYYREQFMPRYSELLRRYYASLAEQKKKGSEDR